MTLFLNYRSDGQAGVVISEPRLVETGLPGLGDKAVWHKTPPTERWKGRHVLFATHGYNVDQNDGRFSLQRLEKELDLGDQVVFIGVLWPGDFHHIFINYPAEGKDAAQCGARLAVYAAEHMKLATGASFLSHSLGGRVVLEAVSGLAASKVIVDQVCLAAPAVDSTCLNPKRPYDRARQYASRIAVMASEKDEALGVVYSAGSLAAKLVGDDHPFGQALGHAGPTPTNLPKVEVCQIGPKHGWKHGDYFPPADPNKPDKRSARSIGVMKTILGHGKAVWPFPKPP